ncbi:MAG: hypothetical protein HY858_09875 [Candidatus Solibacter usitatus]|nr:hypothetical protein [Candidatus Solibacter usitatus]
MRPPTIPALLLLAWPLVFFPLFAQAPSQAIEFESNGLHYQTITRSGLTIMFAPLPVQVREYVVVQVAVSNGAPSARTVKPEDFRFVRADGTAIAATPARQVVQQFLDKGGRNDVIRLVGTYEVGLYGLSRFTSTNGYEQRRQAALAEVSSSRLKAAAAASAIVLVTTRLQSGESTDGAVFFSTQGKPLGAGKLIAIFGAERFEFEVGGLRHPGELIRRP